MRGQIFMDIKAGIPPATRAPFLDAISALIWTLFHQCWGPKPNERPNAKAIVTHVQQIRQSMQELGPDYLELHHDPKLPLTNAASHLELRNPAMAAQKRANDDILQHSFRTLAYLRHRIALDAVISSSFVAENIIEPIFGSTEDGDSLMFNGSILMGLGDPGKSVYTVFLQQAKKGEWRCLFGDARYPCFAQAIPFRRLERALDHVRSHLNHRPFECKGECQKGKSW
jgi:hypothetical protein